MATLPLYLNQDGIYSAEDLALPWRDPLREGVIYTPPLPAGLTDPLKVGPIAPASMGVQVNAGACYIRNRGADDSEAYYRGGMWRVAFTSAQQVAVDAAHATLSRYDRVIAEVLDTQFGGASNQARLRVVKGTPAASPAVPPIPRSCLELAFLAVAAAATTITAGAINDVRQTAGATGPGARVFHNGPLSVPNAAMTTLQFNSERYDQGVMHDPAATSRLVARVPGLYLAGGGVSWAAGGAATQIRILRIAHTLAAGGTLTVASVAGPPATGATDQIASAVLQMAAGDYVEAIAYQDSGAAKDVTVQPNFSPEFWLTRIA